MRTTGVIFAFILDFKFGEMLPSGPISGSEIIFPFRERCGSNSSNEPKPLPSAVPARTEIWNIVEENSPFRRPARDLRGRKLRRC